MWAAEETPGFFAPPALNPEQRLKSGQMHLGKRTQRRYSMQAFVGSKESYDKAVPTLAGRNSYCNGLCLGHCCSALLPSQQCLADRKVITLSTLARSSSIRATPQCLVEAT